MASSWSSSSDAAQSGQNWSPRATDRVAALGGDGGPFSESSVMSPPLIERRGRGVLADRAPGARDRVPGPIPTSSETTYRCEADRRRGLEDAEPSLRWRRSCANLVADASGPPVRAVGRAASTLAVSLGWSAQSATARTDARWRAGRVKVRRGEDHRGQRRAAGRGRGRRPGTWSLASRRGRPMSPSTSSRRNWRCASPSPRRRCLRPLGNANKALQVVVADLWLADM